MTNYQINDKKLTEFARWWAVQLWEQYDDICSSDRNYTAQCMDIPIEDISRFWNAFEAKYRERYEQRGKELWGNIFAVDIDLMKQFILNRICDTEPAPDEPIDGCVLGGEGDD